MRKIEITKQKWNPISGIQTPIITRVFEGLNQISPFAIKDSHATRIRNLTTKLFPAAAVRDGYTMIQGAGFTQPIQAMAVYKGLEFHVISGGVWKAYVAGTWATIKTGLSTAGNWHFVNFQGNFAHMNLIAANGIDRMLRYDGSYVYEVANAPATADMVATHDNRLYAASSGGDTVHYSALRKAEDWNTVGESGSIVVESSDGQHISGLVAGSARLTIFKKNSIYELFGTKPANYTMKLVTDNLGSPTGKSAQVIEGVIFFLGNDGIYQYSGGSLPNADFSLPVKDYIKTINNMYTDRIYSWSEGRRYYLAIPTHNNIWPNVILEYDLNFNTWNVWEFAKRVTAAVTKNGVLHAGNELGELFQFDGAATDGGTAITWEWVSKPFSYSSLASKSRWYRLWAVVDVPVGSTLRIHVSDKDEGEDWTLVNTITGSADTQAKEILIPVNLVAHSSWIRLRIEGTGKATIHEVSRQERVFPMGLT